MLRFLCGEILPNIAGVCKEMNNQFSKKTYVCIDLKSFYASVECADRGLDPFTTNLVVADPTRTEKTICLAITPAMKAKGVPNRCRVFQIPKGMEYIMAPPRMTHYMEVSRQIVSIYLRHVSPLDLFAYSIDECFIDATPYLAKFGGDARVFANALRDDVLKETKITATAGIGTNLFLAKLALDVMAKHAPDGIGWLDEDAFRRDMWHHRPITDVWNIGSGIARRLEKYHVYDLYGITRMDVDVLYKEFGVNAEYIIDHAWGIEPCTIEEIHAYTPSTNSHVNSQVLPRGYTNAEAHLIMTEMLDQSVLELVRNKLVCGRISLHTSFERDSRECPTPAQKQAAKTKQYWKGAYGSGGASKKLAEHTNSRVQLLEHFNKIWNEKVDPRPLIRRISLGFDNLEAENGVQYDLFCDVEALEEERARQKAVLAIQDKFGKNALQRATSLTSASTILERNGMVGGHRG